MTAREKRDSINNLLNKLAELNQKYAQGRYRNEGHRHTEAVYGIAESLKILGVYIYHDMVIELCMGWRAGRYAEIQHLAIAGPLAHTTNTRWGAGAKESSLNDARDWIDANAAWLRRYREIDAAAKSD